MNHSIRLEAPYKIAILSDVHIGAKEHLSKCLESAINYIIGEKIKVILNGDLIENSIISGHDSGSKILDQTMFPTEQMKEAASIFKRLKEAGLLEVIIEGNHEARTKRDSLLNLSDLLASWLDVPYGGIGGYVTVYAGKQEYVGAIQHGRSGSSNTWGELDRMLKVYPKSEWVALGHNHDLNHRKVPHIDLINGREAISIRHQIRTGTFLGYADYSRNMCLQPGLVGCPIMTFQPVEHKIEVDIQTLSWTPEF